MDIKIKTGLCITTAEFDAVLGLDLKAYGDDIFTDPGLAQARFLKNRDCLILAYDGDRLAGFWCFFPVTDEFMDKVYSSGEMWDDNIAPEHIIPYRTDAVNHIFALDLVVDREYRGMRIASTLMAAFRDFLRDKMDKGYRFDKVFGYTVSEGGGHMMKRCGARTIGPRGDGLLFEFDVARFTERIMVEARRLTKAEIKTCAALLTKCFASDPLYRAIFLSPKEINMFMRLCLKYYNKAGEIHIARAGGRIVGLSVWNPHGTRVMGVRSLVDCGMLPQLIAFASSIHMPSLNRLRKEFFVTESQHFRGMHNYLYMICSDYPGAGSALMNFTKRRFRGMPIYLENSNITCNRSFYEKHGFTLLGRITVLNVEVDLMVAGTAKSAPNKATADTAESPAAVDTAAAR